MGSVLRLASEIADVGHVPRPFDGALREARFRRALPKDAVGAFLRSAIHPERANELVAGPIVSLALQRLESFVQQDAEAADGALDLLFLGTARRTRIHEARLRTAWPTPGAWNERLTGPIAARDPWRDVSEGQTRGEVMRTLGEVAVRADGSIVRPGHPLREPTGPRAERFLSKESPVELLFRPPQQHPDWRALVAFVAGHPALHFRFTDVPPW